MTGLLDFWNLKAVKKSAIALLALLVILLAVSFLPFGNDGSSGGNAVVKEKTILLEQLQELNNLPPAVDVKLEPAVKDDIKEALYLAAAAKSPKEAAEKRKVEMLVKASSEDAGNEIKKAGGEILNAVDSVDKTAKYFAVKADADKVAAIAADNDVTSISQRGDVYPTLDSSVPVIKADAFWNAGYKGSGVRVAVLDTGIDKNHPMLQGKVVAERDFTSSGTAADDCGHGTHVAGIVTGSTANGGLYDGVSPDAQLLNAKVLTLSTSGKCGGKVDYLIAAISWALDPDSNPATDDGARVISMSLGGIGDTSASLESELKAAVAKGAVVVVSSGNCGSGCPDLFACGSFRGVTWPGNSPSVITVGAVDDSKNVACFSSGENVQNVGIKPDFAAPGVDVTSSVPGSGYESKKGTSMAAPHVSGAVALLLSKSPGINQGDVVRILEKTALDLGAVGKDTSYGFGLLDMAKALVYKEGLEVSVELEKQIISGGSQKITVTVYDDVQVNSVKATVTKPNNAKTDVTFSSSGGNVYTYDYADTALMGNYVVDVAVNYGGTSGSSGTGSEGGGEPGSGSSDSSSITVTRTAYFKVTSLTGDFGNIEDLNILQQQKLSSNLTGTIKFANTATVELNFSALLQLLKINNGTADAKPLQEIRQQPVTIAANSKVTAAVNNALKVGPGNYTLRILTDYGAGSLVNETNITVADDLAPQVLGIDYRKSIKVNDAQVIIVQLYEHQKMSTSLWLYDSLKFSKYDGNPMKPMAANYTIKAIGEFGNNKTLAIAIYNVSNVVGGVAFTAGMVYAASLHLCDESGNCVGNPDVPQKDAEFTVTDCSGKHVLVVKTFDDKSVFEEAATSSSGVCLSVLNKSTTGTPPASYLEKFDAVVWSTGTDLVNIDGNDAAALTDYYGKKGKIVVEGSDVAFRHGNDDFMRSVLRSELKTDLGFTVTSVANMSSLSINITRSHPVVAGLATPMFFNATIDPFPDAVQPHNGSMEFAAWSGLEVGGSAIVAYESEDGKAKSLFLPFSIDALNEGVAESFAASSLEWLLGEASMGIMPVRLSHDGFLVEGQIAATAIIQSSEQLQTAPIIDVFADGKLASSGPLDIVSASSSQPWEYAYPFEATLGTGQRTVTVVANSDFSVSENNYINNLAEYNLTVYPSEPDLLVSGMSSSYNSDSAAIVLDVNVSNMGGASAASSLKVYLDNAEAAEQSFALDGGQRKLISFELPSDKGIYSLRAVVDPGNSVAEHNESNNELQETIYLCSREKILVVDDNDAEFYSTENPSSANEFVGILKNAEYCVELWDESQQGTPSLDYSETFPLIVWSAGDYFGNVTGVEDRALLNNYSKGVLIEGSDIAMELAESAFFESISGAIFSHDMLPNSTMELLLNSHSITDGIASIAIDEEKSPYPDSVETVNGDVVAEWPDGGAAITALNSGRKSSYYGFSVDAVTDSSVREMLVLNTVEWLLKVNKAPEILNITGDFVVNESEIVRIRVEAYDPEGDILTVLLNDSRFNASNGLVDGVGECGGIIGKACSEGLMCVVPEGCFDCFGVCHVNSSSVVEFFEWQTSYTDAGAYLVEVTVSDGNSNSSGFAEVIVKESANNPPTSNLEGISEETSTITMNEGQTKNFSVIATDPDGDPLTYTWLLNGTIVSTTANFSFSPKYNESGTYNLTVAVSDGQDEVRLGLTVVVLDTLDCEAGQTRLCALQLGVCSESFEACSDGKWPGCSGINYGNHSIYYETEEDSCDALDNDCDGSADEGFEDYDADNVADCIDTDLDNDGIDDNEDDIIGNGDDINFTGTVKNIKIGFDDEDGKKKKVKINNSNKPLLEFSYNFSKGNMLLRNMTIAKQGDESGEGFTLVRGLNLRGGTKSVYVDRLISGSNAVCAKDSDVAEISEVTSGCSDEEESLLTCELNPLPAVDKNSLSCQLMQQTGQFIITGLKHSAVVEQCIDSDADSYLPLGCGGGLDCNDANSTISPAAVEVCNGVDDDCNGLIDENRVCNTPPLLAFIGNKTVDENATISFTIAASDNEADELLYNASKLPEGARFNNLTATFNWTPDIEQAGAYLIVFNVSDGLLFDFEKVNITVINVNRAPVIDSYTPGLVMNENDSQLFEIVASDPDGDILSYSWKLNGAEVSTATYYTFPPGFDDAGEHSITFTVSDGKLSDSEEIIITVNNVNRGPVLGVISNLTVNENETVVVEPAASDPDGDELSFDFASPLNSSGMWHATFDDAGLYAATVTVSDGDLNDSAGFNITVLNVNRPPVITAVLVEPSGFVMNEAETKSFFSAVGDADGDTLSIAWKVNNELVSTEASFEFSPGYDESGEHVIAVEVSDGELANSQEFVVTVNNVNRAPVLEPIGNITVNENETVVVSPVASDPDGDGIFFTYSAPLDEQGKWGTSFDDAGLYAATVTVSDGDLNDSAGFNITVLNANRPPVMSAIGNRTARENETITFPVVAEDPDGGDALEFSMSAPIAAAGAELADGVFSWTPDFEQSGTYGFSFSASDGELTAAAQMNITVKNVNRHPAITSITITAKSATLGEGEGGEELAPAAVVLEPEHSGTVNETDTVIVTITASDPDGDAVTFSLNDSRFTPYAGSGDAAGGSEQAFAWKTGYDDSGTYHVEATVSDGSLTDAENFSVTVLHVNRAPVWAETPEDQSILEDTSLLYDTDAIDPDGDALAYSVNDASFSISSEGVLSWTPPENYNGVKSVVLTASDGDLSANQEISVTVIPVNDPPVIDDYYPKASAGGAFVPENIEEDMIAISEGAKQMFNVTVSDVDNDVLTTRWYLNGSPVSSSLFYLYASSFFSAGTYNVTAVVSDAEFSVGKEWLMAVLDIKTPPQVKGIWPASPMIEGESKTLFVYALDLDKDALEYQWYLDGKLVSEEQTFEYVTDYLSAGFHNLTAVVSDGELEGRYTRMQQVANNNRPPEIQYVEPNLSVILKENESASFSVAASDPDSDDVLTYRWLFDGKTVGAMDYYTYHADFKSAGFHMLVVFVYDNHGLRDAEAVDLEVLNVNQNPIILFGPKDISMQEGEKRNLTVKAYHPDWALVSYAWYVDAKLVSEQETFEYSPDYDSAGMREFYINVSDKIGKSVSHSFAVDVLNTDRPPVLASIANISVKEKEPVVIVAIASDPDNENEDLGDDNELAFSVSDSRFVQSGNVFTAQQGFYAGEYLVNVRVFDGQRTDYQNVNITIRGST